MVLLFKQPRVIKDYASFIPVLGGLVLTRRELSSALQFLLLTGTYQISNHVQPCETFKCFKVNYYIPLTRG